MAIKEENEIEQRVNGYSGKIRTTRDIKFYANVENKLKNLQKIVDVHTILFIAYFLRQHKKKTNSFLFFFFLETQIYLARDFAFANY